MEGQRHKRRDSKFGTKASDDVFIYGYNLSRHSSPVQYIILASCLFLFYILSGIAQEALFSSHPGFHYGLFMTLFHFTFNAVVSSRQFAEMHSETLPTTAPQRLPSLSVPAFVGRIVGRDRIVALQLWLSRTAEQIGIGRPWWLSVETRTPLRIYVATAAATVLGIGLSNQSLSYLNFPTRTLFKSSKLLFVMGFGSIVLGKRYSIWDYAASVQLILGLIMLYLANVTVSISLDMVGLVLILSSLTCDAVIGNVQEKILQQYGSTPTEMLFFINLIGSVLALLACIVSGQFFEAIAFCFEHPMVLVYMGVRSLLCISRVVCFRVFHG